MTPTADTREVLRRVTSYGPSTGEEGLCTYLKGPTRPLYPRSSCSSSLFSSFPPSSPLPPFFLVPFFSVPSLLLFGRDRSPRETTPPFPLGSDRVRTTPTLLVFHTLTPFPVDLEESLRPFWTSTYSVWTSRHPCPDPSHGVRPSSCTVSPSPGVVSSFSISSLTPRLEPPTFYPPE